ncbi:MAG: hypothetical protein WCE53_03335 [Candidatus Acidiferrum sp.]
MVLIEAFLYSEGEFVHPPSQNALRVGLSAALLLACSAAGSVAQIKFGEEQKINHDVRCVIQAERRQWNRSADAVVSGTIENLTDGPLEIKVYPVFYLSSKTSNELGDRYWAPADLLHDTPLGMNKQAIGAGGKAVTVEPQPIFLRFEKKGDRIDFRIDARHLLWAKEIWSGWPSSALFSTVKTDDYALQLELGTEHGKVKSSEIDVSIDVSKRPKD